MPFIYITGVSGSGKSTIRHELLRLGYKAYDVDERSFRTWYNRKTDKPASDQKQWVDTDIEWRKKYWLKIDPDKVEALAEIAKKEDKPVFLSGITPNDHDIWHLFDKVISLSLSHKTLEHRLKSRTNNDYGKHPEDFKKILGWNDTIDEEMKEKGAILINSDRPIDKVVREILSISQ